MTYWRRRFIALTIGLGILSLIAWAFSGALGGSRAGGGGAAGRARASHAHAVSARTGSGGPGSAAGPGAQPQASASATAQPSASPATGAQAQVGHEPPAQLAAAVPGALRACKPGNIVLSLFVGQDSYGQGQLPEFDVDVVSTAGKTCGFNVGAKHLSLVVWERGTRVWASADCAAGHGMLTTELARGVPVIVPISWNRQTSARACQGAGRQAAAGRYTASASDGDVASNPVGFTVG